MNYDISYYDNLLRRYSATALPICKLRWEFVARLRPRTVLDYGSGVGWFRAWKPTIVECDTYDIMPVFQTGITRDRYDLITFWDSLEHIPHNEYGALFAMTDAVALTLPIKPADVRLDEWKHWKPQEHIFLPSTEELLALFDAYGFRLLDHDMRECPPREDVHSFLFVRPSHEEADFTEHAESR